MKINLIILSAAAVLSCAMPLCAAGPRETEMMSEHLEETELQSEYCIALPEREVWRSSEEGFAGMTSGLEESPVSPGEPGIGFIYDYSGNSSAGSYYQVSYTFHSIKAGEEAMEAYKQLEEEGIITKKLDEDLCEPRIMEYTISLPDDMPDKKKGYLPYPGVSIETPGKGYLEYGKEGFFFVNSYYLSGETYLHPGETALLKTLLIMPKDLKEGYIIHIMAHEGFYANL